MPEDLDRRRWLHAALAGAGRSRTGDLEEVRRRPWGAVWKVVGVEASRGADATGRR